MKSTWIAFALTLVACHGGSASSSDASASAVPLPPGMEGATDMHGPMIAPVLYPPGAPCGPTRITMGGQPMGIVSTRAYGFDSVPDAYVIVLSDKTVSCSQLIERSRIVPPDEIAIKVASGPNEAGQQYVSSDYTQVGVRTDVTLAPKKVGDPIEICVRQAGTLVADRPPRKMLISVSGLIKGTYCGNVK